MIINRCNLTMKDGLPPEIAPPLDRLWTYWASLNAKNKGKLPPKSAIRISGLGGVLPNIVISERMDDDTVLIRLAGTAMEEMIGDPLTGVNLLDLTPPSQRDRIARVYANLFSFPCGFHILESLRADGGKKYMLSAIALPLASDEGDARFTIAQYAIKRHGFDDNVLKSDAVIEHRQIDSFGYIDVGSGVPER